jgi:hypothetical protein
VNAAVASTGWLSNRRNVALAALFAVALSLAVAIGIYNRGSFQGLGTGDAARQALKQGVNGINALGETVAGLFGSRSPGERAEGTLANLKHRRSAGLHQRALPKVRRGPLAAIRAPAAPPATPPEAAPLYNVVTDTPKALLPGTPLGLSPIGGGPGVFSGLTPTPGGGGVIVSPPPAVNPPETPTTPVTPVIPPTAAVPEPASWMMMLFGFLLTGSMVRRRSRAALLPT